MSNLSSISRPGLTSDPRTSEPFSMELVQSPKEGRTLAPNVRMKGGKYPLDPPPVLELINSQENPNLRLHIHDPNWFCFASIASVDLDKKRTSSGGENKIGSKGEDGDNLSGQLCSSVHKMKWENQERGYFAFGDLSIRDPGTYKLKFTLFQICPHTIPSFDGTEPVKTVYAKEIHSIITDGIRVHSGRTMSQVSTELSKSLSEAGVKLRIRKEVSKRRAPAVEWHSRLHETIPTPHLPPLQIQAAMGPLNSRASRNLGEDISNRLTAIHEPMHPDPSHGPRSSPPRQPPYHSDYSSTLGQDSRGNNLQRHTEPFTLPMPPPQQTRFNSTMNHFYQYPSQSSTPTAWMDHQRNDQIQAAPAQMAMLQPQRDVRDSEFNLMTRNPLLFSEQTENARNMANHESQHLYNPQIATTMEDYAQQITSHAHIVYGSNPVDYQPYDSTVVNQPNFGQVPQNYQFTGLPSYNNGQPY